MANPFLQVSDMVSQYDSLNYIQYDQIRQTKQDFLLSNQWDWDWVTRPKAVFMPDNSYLKAHMKGCTPTFNSQIGEVSATIRHNKIRQSVMSGDQGGTITIEYEDFEDQGISAWLDDWREKFGDRKYHYAFRLEDTYADGLLTQFNSSRRPIRKWTVQTIQLNDPGNAGFYTPGLTGEDPADLGAISAVFAFENAYPVWNNI
jgi:hypothetical protein